MRTRDASRRAVHISLDPGCPVSDDYPRRVPARHQLGPVSGPCSAGRMGVSWARGRSAGTVGQLSFAEERTNWHTYRA